MALTPGSEFYSAEYNYNVTKNSCLQVFILYTTPNYHNVTPIEIL